MEVVNKAKLPHGMASTFMEQECSITWFQLYAKKNFFSVLKMVNTLLLLFVLDLEPILSTSIYCEYPYITKSRELIVSQKTIYTNCKCRPEYIQRSQLTSYVRTILSQYIEM